MNNDISADIYFANDAAEGAIVLCAVGGDLVQARACAETAAAGNDPLPTPRDAARIVDEYRRECERTARQFADADDDTSQRIYWRADGAIDALEVVAERLRKETT